MTRRSLLVRLSQITAGLGLGGYAASNSKSVAAKPAVDEIFPAGIDSLRRQLIKDQVDLLATIEPNGKWMLVEEPATAVEWFNRDRNLRTVYYEGYRFNIASFEEIYDLKGNLKKR